MSKLSLKNRCKKCGAELKTGEKRYCSLDCRIEFNIYKGKDGCWIWKGRVRKTGYVSIKVNKIDTSVTRYLFSKQKEQIDDNYFLMKNCNNNLCVNPNHLTKVTKEYFYKNRAGYCKYNKDGILIPSKRMNPLIIEKIIEMSKVGYNSHEISEVYNKKYEEKFRQINVENFLSKNPPWISLFDLS